jgi:hypothetical protein
MSRIIFLFSKSLSSRRETQVIAVSLKDGINQLENSLCRGSLAWFGRQTHNLENTNGGQTPDVQKSRARIPPPAPFSPSLQHFFVEAISSGKFLSSLFFFRFSFTIHRMSASCCSASCRMYSKPSLGTAHTMTLKE